MVEGNVFMYLGFLCMVEMVIGEKVLFEEMGGVCMYCFVLGCGDFFVWMEQEVIMMVQIYFSYFLVNYIEKVFVNIFKNLKVFEKLFLDVILVY